MQLLDFSLNRPLDSSEQTLLNALQDITYNLEIQSNFCISHPNYKPLDLPAEAIDRFEKVPSELQEKYLSLQLRNFLYGIYYNGSLRDALTLETDTTGLALHQNLENNSILGINLEFWDRLHQSNNGEGYYAPDWFVVREESDGSLAVTKNGLTLHLDRDRHLKLEEQSAVIGDLVAIKMPRNLVQNGFYMAVGNAGHNRGGSQIVRIYFNLSSEGAVAVMRNLTQQLNQIEIPFAFKALYNPDDYKRYDSAVLYLDRNYYQDVQPVLQTVYTDERSHFQAQIPLFTKFLAPGLAVAEEPNYKFAAVESFGMNRCQIVANGLLESRQKGDKSTEYRMNAIFQQFSLLGLDWQRPYLNANAEDIYAPLDIRSHAVAP